jgi:hypothetical protein
MHALRSLFATHSHASRRLIVSLGAALLVIVGLLAMHGFNVDAGHASGGTTMVTSTETVSHHPAPAEHPDLLVGECGEGCGDAGHLTMAMVCVLALLAAVFALTTPPAKSRGGLRESLQQRLESWAGSLAPLRPPSLIVLSISRT